MPATLKRFMGGSLQDFVPFAQWTRGTLEVFLADASYSERLVHRRHFLSLFVLNHQDTYTKDDPPGETAGEHRIIGFTVYASLARFLADEQRTRWSYLYEPYRLLHNKFEFTRTLTHLMELANKRHAELFGPYKKDLWRIIHLYDETHGLRVHIPLP
ncbi:MAG: hypothetical protein A2408_02800 [Candidatus Yonathbacteria bacterium RIFOXYC1_FULL_52_10]|nr:MAG: hypothetical protein A2408_02800 [Candidatus Yonathbacteria bacterium RIFOXYC1_FULL_52_10]